MKLQGRMLGRLLLIGALAAPLAAWAQGAAAAQGEGGCANCGGRGGGPGMRGFDPAAVTTVQGQVADIQRVAMGRRGHEGVHLTLAMGSETVEIRLGPASHVDAQALKLAKGDTVEVKGAQSTIGGRRVIVAQEVRRGGEVLALRDANGVPAWRGQGMRHGR